MKCFDHKDKRKNTQRQDNKDGQDKQTDVQTNRQASKEDSEYRLGNFLLQRTTLKSSANLSVLTELHNIQRPL